MSRLPFTIPLASAALRNKAMEALKRAPDGFRVTFEEPRRSEDQSAKFHAMVREVSRQCQHGGEKLNEDQWKQVFISALAGDKIVPSLDGKAFISIRKSTSRMSKAELSDLIEIVYAYGAEHGVEFKEFKTADAA